MQEHTPEGLKLNNPAGHLDPGETPQQGVVREALEETARAFTPEALVGVYLARFRRPATGEDVTYLRFAFCGTVGEPPTRAARWTTPIVAHAVADAGTDRRAAGRVAQRTGRPLHRRPRRRPALPARSGAAPTRACSSR